ncbi:HNH endonuclease [Vibrio fluvialis]|uniref:HNH endonuclease n=1 Tax=Vibrio fluvialis TaxID=676 RepID=UPI001EECD193|nr:HNH endonuclease [Vibrio fluvialis]
MTWATDLVQALENLGGQAQLSDIYNEIENIRPNLTNAWKSSVRERIQRHSSDSFSYNPDNPDLFYSVEGLGSGIWGLRSSLTKTPVASDIDGGNETTLRAKQEVYRILRDTMLARKIKKLHKDQCQLCNTTVRLKNNETYSEAHHIIPIGKPHHGPDTPENIIVVCPTCHVLCDYGAIILDIKQIKQRAGHSISIKSINYHNESVVGGL